MNDLYEKYGYCQIPKDTYLFRSNTDIGGVLFFATNVVIASSFNKESKLIQIWKTTKEVDVLFMVSNISESRGWVKSAIVELYQSFYPNEMEIDDLEIKQFNFGKRQKLIAEMEKQGVNGWFSSLENRVELEICLFTNNNLQLVEKTDDVLIYKQYNVLEKIKINPSVKFYDHTSKNIEEFKKHKKWYQNAVKDAVNIGISKEEAKADFYNLRMKLKI